MRPLPALTELAANQASVVSRVQCARAGLTPAAIEHRLAVGVWQPVHPRVYATTNGTMPADGALWAALLYAGDGAVISHASAGAVHGWPVPTEEMVHVTVPRERRPRKQPGLDIRRASVSAEDIVWKRGLPVTSPERTVVDLLGSCDSVDDALALVSRAVQTRTTTAAKLGKRITTARSAKWRTASLDALADVAAGSHSRLELAFAGLLRQHGLPLGRRQARVAVGSRTTYVDMAYGDTVVVELDGRLGHDSATDIWRDMERDNASALAGRTVLRFGWADVHRRPCGVAGQVGAVLKVQLARCGDRCSLSND